ncbi:MAG: Arc family DNA binding domain-containing protein [Bacteroidetes bacterium]|nr:Arc family DNA binding domain-containing protein [Bacteroidota bacterium]
MAGKKTFVLRIDEDVFKALEKWSGDEFRSVNGQLEWIINKALKEAKRAPKSSKAKGEKEDEQ